MIAKRLRHALRALMLPLVVAMLVLSVGPSSDAHAQSRSFDEGPSVRRQLLHRSSRLEISPTLGSSFGRSYQRDLVLNVGLRYFLTNSFGVGINVMGGYAMDTSLAENYRIADPLGARNLRYATQSFLVDGHISYSPLSGKFNLIGNKVFHYDLYLTLGVAAVLVGGEADDLSGLRFGPAVSLGLRTFVTDQIAVTLQVSDYLYSSAEAQRFSATGGLPVEESFSNHFFGTIGVSIFFPGKVRISR